VLAQPFAIFHLPLLPAFNPEVSPWDEGADLASGNFSTALWFEVSPHGLCNDLPPSLKHHEAQKKLQLLHYPLSVDRAE